MRTCDLCVIGEPIMRHRRVLAESGDLHVTDLTAFPLVGLVLQFLDEFIPRLPCTPTISRDETVGQVLLRPRRIALHLRISGLLLELLDLLSHISSVNIDGDNETAEHSYSNRSCFFHLVDLREACGLYTSRVCSMQPNWDNRRVSARNWI
jgi:hypothetical protein